MRAAQTPRKFFAGRFRFKKAFPERERNTAQKSAKGDERARVRRVAAAGGFWYTYHGEMGASGG